MTVKDQVQAVLKELPEDCTIEDVQYHLYVVQTIQRGLKEADETPGVPHSEVRKRVTSWLKK